MANISDLTGTTWVFNNQISMSPLHGDEYVFNVGFLLTEDLTPGGGFSLVIEYLSFDNPGGLYLEYINIDVAYSDNTWQNSAFKSITITGGTDATNPDLIAWLQNNATQVIETQPFSVVKFNNLTLGRINNHYLSTFNGVSVLSGKSAGGSLISFTIDSRPYQAEEGMTWAEWVESEYNTDGFSIRNNCILDPISVVYHVYHYVYYNRAYVLKTATLVPNRAYTSVGAGAGD